MIVNPVDNIKHSIYSNIGREILKKYINFFKTGGSKDITKKTIFLDPIYHDPFLAPILRDRPTAERKSDFKKPIFKPVLPSAPPLPKVEYRRLLPSFPVVNPPVVNPPLKKPWWSRSSYERAFDRIGRQAHNRNMSKMLSSILKELPKIEDKHTLPKCNEGDICCQTNPTQRGYCTPKKFSEEDYDSLKKNINSSMVESTFLNKNPATETRVCPENIRQFKKLSRLDEKSKFNFNISNEKKNGELCGVKCQAVGCKNRNAEPQELNAFMRQHYRTNILFLCEEHRFILQEANYKIKEIFRISSRKNVKKDIVVMPPIPPLVEQPLTMEDLQRKQQETKFDDDYDPLPPSDRAQRWLDRRLPKTDSYIPPSIDYYDERSSRSSREDELNDPDR